MFSILKPLLRRPLMPLLVTLQVALACAIATNALFLLQQKLAPILAPSGIDDPARIVALSEIALRGTHPIATRVQTVEEGLRAVAGVERVTYAGALPAIPDMKLEGGIAGADPHAKVDAMLYLGDNFVDTLGLKLVAGRNFTPEEDATTLDDEIGLNRPGPIILTRDLADRLFPDGHALGRVVHFPNQSDAPGRTIVGIVAHLMRNQFAHHVGELEYAMLLPGSASPLPMPMFAVRLSTSNSARVCKGLKKVVQRSFGTDLLPGSEIECQNFATLQRKMLAQPRAAVWLLAGVTLIVLIVTLTGIMGLTGYWVQQRTHSIGIRRALGAKRRDILRELLIENLSVVGIGMLVGLVAAYGINLWLMRHYELPRLPWIYMPAGAVLLLVLGQLAALTPALHAARLSPAVATRSA